MKLRGIRREEKGCIVRMHFCPVFSWSRHGYYGCPDQDYRHCQRTLGAVDGGPGPLSIHPGPAKWRHERRRFPGSVLLPGIPLKRPPRIGPHPKKRKQGLQNRSIWPFWSATRQEGRSPFRGGRCFTGIRDGSLWPLPPRLSCPIRISGPVTARRFICRGCASCSVMSAFPNW